MISEVTATSDYDDYQGFDPHIAMQEADASMQSMSVPTETSHKFIGSRALESITGTISAFHEIGARTVIADFFGSLPLFSDPHSPRHFKNRIKNIRIARKLGDTHSE